MYATSPPSGRHVAWPGVWDPLGVTCDENGANVSVWSSAADGIELCVFDGDGRESRYELAERSFHTFHGYVPGLRAGMTYGFRAHGSWDPVRGHRFHPATLLIDPSARAIEGRLTLHPAIFGHAGSDDLVRDDQDSAPFVPRSIITADTFDWGDDQSPNTAWGDTVIYEAHVKGMTAMHPGVPVRLRGTYAGMASDAVIEHLLALGVTAVELLPVHHFVSETHLLAAGLTNYWGYNSLGYFAPHGGYSASGTRGQQIGEFKAMVRSLHAAGLEVILDVVYNHTAEGNHLGPTLSLRGLDNRAYYRLSPDGQHYTDYTGTGNTLDAAKPHVLQMIMDSLRYWVTEMHVDGFRFDLASALARSFHDVDMLGSFLTTIQQDPILRRVKLIAEPWDVGAGGYQVGEFPPLWTEWNDKYRDTLREFWRGGAGVGELGWRLTGSADLYASEGRRPFASINYITAHDGFTMRDLVTYKHKHNEANGEDNRDGSEHNRSTNYGVEGETDDDTINSFRRRHVRSLYASLLLSTGVPMITMGDEIGHTQRGNNNAYCQDNEISWLDWHLQPWQIQLLRCAQRLGQLRRRHRVFRQRYFFHGQPHGDNAEKDLAWFDMHGAEMSQHAWHSPDTRTLSTFINGRMKARNETGEPMVDDSFLIILHAGDEAVHVRLPAPPYGPAFIPMLDTVDEEGRPASTDPVPAGGTVLVRARTVQVLRAAG